MPFIITKSPLARPANLEPPPARAKKRHAFKLTDYDTKSQQGISRQGGANEATKAAYMIPTLTIPVLGLI
jgi:hypothetical protein